jgi:hypothetical protein
MPCYYACVDFFPHRYCGCDLASIGSGKYLVRLSWCARRNSQTDSCRLALACMEGTLGRSKGPKPPKGEEKKNQLDLFRDWAVEAAKRAAAAAVAAREVAASKAEELWAAFDKRCLTLCGLHLPMLGAYAYNGKLNAFVVIVVVAATLSALLLVVPWVANRLPDHTDRVAYGSSKLATLLFIVSVLSFSADILQPFLVSPRLSQGEQQTVVAPKTEPAPLQAPPSDERSLSEEAQREAATKAKHEAERVAECQAKETSADKASETVGRRERDYKKCENEWSNALTFKSLITFCGKEQHRLEAAGKKLRAAVADMCTITGSTKRAR